MSVPNKKLGEEASRASQNPVGYVKLEKKIKVAELPKDHCLVCRSGEDLETHLWKIDDPMFRILTMCPEHQELFSNQDGWEIDPDIETHPMEDLPEEEREALRDDKVQEIEDVPRPRWKEGQLIGGGASK